MLSFLILGSFTITSAQKKKAPGKDAVIEKIVAGRINKYFKEFCLNEQPYIKDDKQSIKQLLPQGTHITSFTRLTLG